MEAFSFTMKNIKLLTGVPRSGTTLCCKLLNNAENVIALHEPIDPVKINSIEKTQATTEVVGEIRRIKHALLTGAAFEHGDKNNLVLDNPINTTTSTQLRELKAKRGLITLPPQHANTQLFIKQNAMFAALASQLKHEFTLTAIIRNPMNVFASWFTVNLPVNQGRIPGGEKFDTSFAKQLAMQPNVLDKQIAIYHWFVQQFIKARLNVVKYEDIINTNGNALYTACELNAVPVQPLSTKLSKPQKQTDIAFLRLAANKLDYDLIGKYYRRIDINNALDELITN